MDKYDVQITLRPNKADSGRGSRRFNIIFDAESADQAEDFGRQYFEGFLRNGVELIANANIRH